VATQFASRLALLVFAASAIELMGSRGDLSGTLTTMLIRTAVFYGLGLVCGDLARQLVEEDAQRAFDQWQAAEESRV
jgi:hypothetical protein